MTNVVAKPVVQEMILWHYRAQYRRLADSASSARSRHEPSVLTHLAVPGDRLLHCLGDGAAPGRAVPWQQHIGVEPSQRFQTA